MLIVEGGPDGTLEYRPLWLMNLEGQLLSKVTWNGHNPFWAHNDQSVIYSRRRDYFSELWDIYTLNITTGVMDTLIYAESGPDSANHYTLVDIFPEDDALLLLRESIGYRDSLGVRIDSDHELAIYDTRTGQKIYLTNNDDDEGRARIFPDGRQIIYTKKNAGAYPFSNNLYMSTINGDSLLQLTTGTTYVYLHLVLSRSGDYLVCLRADQSDGYNAYGDVIIYDLDLGKADTLIAVGSEEIYYTPVDWR
jgi:Tol biopolymer transport system component